MRIHENDCRKTLWKRHVSPRLDRKTCRRILNTLAILSSDYSFSLISSEIDAKLVTQVLGQRELN